jgi:integrative and conjugative element protein (TIGR02256 family)
LVDLLCTALQERIGTTGTTVAADDGITIVLLSIPVTRTEGAAPEHFHRKAFGIVGGRLALGEASGAYMVLDGKYYSAKGVLGGAAAAKWRDIPIEAMEVLQQNTPAIARAQSGIDDEGPAGVLVGSGSLGGTMLGFWGRSGWGRWTVIDNDHIKPHNLSRHPALGQQIGEMKANVAAELQGFAMQGANEVTAICADACDFANVAVTMALESNEVVVDASTTLEYPRLASTRDGLARHISVFVTPDGNSSVMLAEDATRELRLRTLEAQYYRAVISADWGKKHLEGNLRHFWSGASCRDISLVMAYSRIAAHAATLAEQVRLILKQPDASIRIWHRDNGTGAVSLHQVAPFAERRMDLGRYDLYIDDSLSKKLRDLRVAQLPLETGGILLGYYDLNVNAVVLVDALAAPPDSKSSREAFERGIAGLRDAVSEATRRTAGIVGYVGEWHSHPPGHSACPSVDDSYQLVYLALRMAEDGLPVVQLIVGENDFLVRQAIVAV